MFSVYFKFMLYSNKEVAKMTGLKMSQLAYLESYYIINSFIKIGCAYRITEAGLNECIEYKKRLDKFTERRKQYTRHKRHS